MSHVCRGQTQHDLRHRSGSSPIDCEHRDADRSRRRPDRPAVVLGECDPRALDLPLTGPATELIRELYELGDAGCPDGVPP